MLGGQKLKISAKNVVGVGDQGILVAENLRSDLKLLVEWKNGWINMFLRDTRVRIRCYWRYINCWCITA